VKQFDVTPASFYVSILMGTWGGPRFATLSAGPLKTSLLACAWLRRRMTPARDPWDAPHDSSRIKPHWPPPPVRFAFGFRGAVFHTGTLRIAVSNQMISRDPSQLTSCA
jgi:hypothetical protein